MAGTRPVLSSRRRSAPMRIGLARHCAPRNGGRTFPKSAYPVSARIVTRLIRVDDPGRSDVEPEKSAVKPDRPAVHFLEQAARRAFDRGTMARERGDEILFARQCRPEVIFQRFRSDRAAHAAAFDHRRKGQGQIQAAIGRMFGRKRYLRDDPLGRLRAAPSSDSTAAGRPGVGRVVA